MARKKGLSPDEIANLLREISEKEPDGGVQDLIPKGLSVDIAHTADVQWCTIVQHYATPDKDSFATKSVDFCYVRGMKVSFTFSLDASGRITVVNLDSSLKRTRSYSSGVHD
ncbi:hypothetical protein TNCV_3537381 [Trichonephila clavipes]|nr:hypothetical protein TNCV_3537381 [Trichonephila clavipes]